MAVVVDVELLQARGPLRRLIGAASNRRVVEFHKLQKMLNLLRERERYADHEDQRQIIEQKIHATNLMRIKLVVSMLKCYRVYQKMLTALAPPVTDPSVYKRFQQMMDMVQASNYSDDDKNFVNAIEKHFSMNEIIELILSTFRDYITTTEAGLLIASTYQIRFFPKTFFNPFIERPHVSETIRGSESTDQELNCSRAYIFDKKINQVDEELEEGRIRYLLGAVPLTLLITESAGFNGKVQWHPGLRVSSCPKGISYSSGEILFHPLGVGVHKSTNALHDSVSSHPTGISHSTGEMILQPPEGVVCATTNALHDSVSSHPTGISHSSGEMLVHPPDGMGVVHTSTDALYDSVSSHRRGLSLISGEMLFQPPEGVVCASTNALHDSVSSHPTEFSHSSGEMPVHPPEGVGVGVVHTSANALHDSVFSPPTVISHGSGEMLPEPLDKVSPITNPPSAFLGNNHWLRVGRWLFRPLSGVVHAITSALHALRNIQLRSPPELPVSSRPTRSRAGRSPSFSAAKDAVIVGVCVPLIVLAFENVSNYNQFYPVESHKVTKRTGFVFRFLLSPRFYHLTFDTTMMLSSLTMVASVARSRFRRGTNARCVKSTLLLLMGSVLSSFALTAYRSF